MLGFFGKISDWFSTLSFKKLLPYLIGFFLLSLAWKFILSLWDSLKNSVLSIGTSISSETAKSIAERIKLSFNNVPVFSSAWTNGLKEELLPLSRADYFMVKSAFGIEHRDLDGTVTTVTLTTDSGDLTWWLNQELYDDQMQELKQLNPIFESIL